jgi:hypothetical protein
MVEMNQMGKDRIELEGGRNKIVSAKKTKLKFTAKRIPLQVLRY